MGSFSNGTLQIGNEILLLVISVNLLISIFLVVFMIVLWRRLHQTNKRYMQMMDGLSEGNLEDAIQQNHENIAKLLKKSKDHENELQQIQAKMKTMKAKVGTCRYNAFNEQGSDLSFSTAIIDEYSNGVVISGIHNRDETYVYAKPLQGGESKYTLSPEEKEAIRLALVKEAAGG